MREVAINGRALGRRMTGVERYASEVAGRLAGHVRIFRPPGAASRLVGLLWEQVCLPALIPRHGVLWSPANNGPLNCERQVVTIHDLGPLEHPAWFHPTFASLYRALLPRLITRVRAISVPSWYTRARLLDNFPNAAGKVFVVPEGVDRKRFTRRGPVETERVRRRYSLPQRYLLAVGTLQPRKNLHRLLAAWRLVGPRLPGSGLVIAGGHGPQFRKLAWETLPPATYFLGYVPEGDLPALYSAALAYILPSLEEGFGLTLLEAMACGTPVLASRAGAIPEVLGEAGQLFDPAQPVEIAAQIEEFFGDEQLRAGLVARGQARARQFTWVETARRTLSLLHSIT